MRELKEHLDRVMLESAQKEQLSQALRKERDRLVRENQAKVHRGRSDSQLELTETSSAWGHEFLS